MNSMLLFGRLKCATVANHNESQAVNFRVSVNDQKPSLANPSNASQDPAVLARRVSSIADYSVFAL